MKAGCGDVRIVEETGDVPGFRGCDSDPDPNAIINAAWEVVAYTCGVHCSRGQVGFGV